MKRNLALGAIAMAVSVIVPLAPVRAQSPESMFLEDIASGLSPNPYDSISGLEKPRAIAAKIFQGNQQAAVPRGYAYCNARRSGMTVEQIRKIEAKGALSVSQSTDKKLSADLVTGFILYQSQIDRSATRYFCPEFSD